MSRFGKLKPVERIKVLPQKTIKKVACNNDIKSVVELVDFISEKEDKIQQIEDRKKEIY